MREIYAERADRAGKKWCPLCRAILDDDKDRRGVVEFIDGWFWVCGECISKLGKVFDCTQQADYGGHIVIRYFRRSRKFVLRYLKEEHQIIITSRG